MKQNSEYINNTELHLKIVSICDKRSTNFPLLILVIFFRLLRYYYLNAIASYPVRIGVQNQNHQAIFSPQNRILVNCIEFHGREVVLR